jgi:hypothetical protein
VTPTGPLNEAQARELTDRIKAHAGVLWDEVAEAYVRRAWAALGFVSWGAYCAEEIAPTVSRVPREARPQLLWELHQAGMSNRSIEAATGINRETVRQELSGGNFLPPGDRVTGSDGKSYPSRRKRPFHPKPTIDDVTHVANCLENAEFALRRAHEAAAKTDCRSAERGLLAAVDRIAEGLAATARAIRGESLDDEATTLTVLLQIYSYVAFSAARYPQSVVEIMGLTAPTF